MSILIIFLVGLNAVNASNVTDNKNLIKESSNDSIDKTLTENSITGIEKETQRKDSISFRNTGEISDSEDYNDTFQNTIYETTSCTVTEESNLISTNRSNDLKGTIQTNYPESYDLRNLSYVTSVKNQINSGSCWAFSTYASLESYLLINDNITYDFSENNLKNLMGYNSTKGTDYHTNSEGGTEFMAAAYLTRWSGPVLESQDPYNATNAHSEEMNATYYVQDIAFLERRENALDNDQIKYVLLNYSPVAVSLYYGNNYFNSSSYSYYYSDTGKAANHMVAIVGWDDNYNASLFKVEAPGNGAFIVKNSFGTGFGDQGYFYISYYDNALAGYNDLAEGNIGGFAILNVEETYAYKTNYQYDILGYNLGWGFSCETGWFASKFTALNNNPLTAVATYFFSENSEYSLYVYVNEELKLTQNGTIEIPGYRTIELTTPVLLNEGDEFRVVIKSTTPGCNYPIPVEAQIDKYSKATSNPNETFVSKNGVNWLDVYSAKANASICLKAFTGYVSNLSLTTTANTTTFNTGDSVLFNITVRNSNEISREINISSVLDSNIKIINYNISSGSYNNITNIWSIGSIDTNESVSLLINTIIGCTNNVITKFNLNTKSYNENNETSSEIKLTIKNIPTDNTVTSINLSSNNATINDTIKITAIVTSKNNIINEGVVIFKINDRIIRIVNVINNKATFDYTVEAILNSGTYNITAEYMGSKTYKPSNSITQFTVTKVKTNLTSFDITTLPGQSITFKAIISNDINNTTTGKVSFKLNGKTMATVKLVNGKAEFTKRMPETTSAKDYVITVVYSGNSKYESTRIEKTLTVNCLEPIITTNPITHENQGIINFTATIKSSSGITAKSGKSTFKINGKSIGTVIVSDGKAILSYNISKYSAGTYTLTITFSGNGQFTESRINSSMNLVKISTEVNSKDTENQLNENISVQSEVSTKTGELINGTLIYKINGKTLKQEDGETIKVEVINGIGTLEYPIPETWTANTYNLTTKLIEDSYYLTSTTESQVKLDKIPTISIINNITSKAKETIELTAYVTTNDSEKVNSKYVIFKINGLTLKYANGTPIQVYLVNGVAKLNYTIPSSWSGTKTISVNYSGTSRLETSKSEGTLIIVK